MIKTLSISPSKFFRSRGDLVVEGHLNLQKMTENTEKWHYFVHFRKTKLEISNQLKFVQFLLNICEQTVEQQLGQISDQIVRFSVHA